MAGPITHNQAAQIVKDEWYKIHNRTPSKLEVLYVLAVGWLESHYGRYPGQHADMAAKNQINWANIEKVRVGDDCPAGWAPGIDSGKNVCFRVFPNDNEAANALIKTLTTRHWPVLDAIANEGTPESVAHAMKVSPAYYSGNEQAYASGLKNSITAIGNELKKESEYEEPPPTQGQSKATGIIAGLVILGVGAGLVHQTLKIKTKQTA